MEDRTEKKSELVDHLSSQIRTLSDAIIGFSNRLADEELDPTQREYLAEIRQAGQGLSGVVEEILEAAQREAKKRTGDPGRPVPAAEEENY